MYTLSSEKDVRSETVDLDRGLGDTLVDQESRDVGTLIALELNDLTGLFVVNKGTVACEFLELKQLSCMPTGRTYHRKARLYLLEGLQKFLSIVFCGDESVKLEQESTW